ncbi:MAG: AtpZ/AtpI family protein [Alphaproteobacteria bacterium]|jgi:ATP synthase protein I|nr:AtpZ/AtpI family protein [Alphaproteobacteria bacterium]
MIENKLKDLEEKITKTKDYALNKDNIKNSAKQANMHEFKIALNCMLELICGFIAGGSIGFALDKLFGTNFVFFIIFIILGFIAGLRNLNKYLGKL